MRPRLIGLLIILVALSVGSQAQTKASNAAAVAGATVPAAASLPLPESDAKSLVELSGQIETMARDMPAANAQAEQSAKLLNQANLFITNYNRLVAERETIRLRAAADVCGCKSTEVELAPDGKSVVRKAASTPPEKQPADKPKP